MFKKGDEVVINPQYDRRISKYLPYGRVAKVHDATVPGECLISWIDIQNGKFTKKSAYTKDSVLMLLKDFKKLRNKKSNSFIIKV